MTARTKNKPVLVTTKHGGVFFGYLKSTDGTTVELKNARNCVYWSRKLRGFLGLASMGPNDNCRIGPKADVTLYDVTCVANVSAGAVERWEAAPWK